MIKGTLIQEKTDDRRARTVDFTQAHTSFTRLWFSPDCIDLLSVLCFLKKPKGSASRGMWSVVCVVFEHKVYSVLVFPDVWVGHPD